MSDRQRCSWAEGDDALMRRYHDEDWGNTEYLRDCALQAGRPAAEIIATWRAGEEAFRRERQPYLLY